MATKNDASLFSSGRVRWTSQSVVFHHSTGKNIELSENNTVATRVRSHQKGIVFTREAVSIGQMFKVTVMRKNEDWVGGLEIGLTGENPENSTLTKCSTLPWYGQYKHLLHIDVEDRVFYNGKELCKLDFSTDELAEGQSFGMLLTRERDLHLFVDNKWKDVVHVDDYPLDIPLWGVADVYGECDQVKAEICTGQTDHEH